MKACPECGAALNRLTGQDGHLAVLVPEVRGCGISGRVVEQKKLQTVHTCPACEHCE